jgi:hypothetical protein
MGLRRYTNRRLFWIWARLAPGMGWKADRRAVFLLISTDGISHLNSGPLCAPAVPKTTVCETRTSNNCLYTGLSAFVCLKTRLKIYVSQVGQPDGFRDKHTGATPCVSTVFYVGEGVTL